MCKCGRATRKNVPCPACRVQAERSAAVRQSKRQRQEAYAKWRASDPLTFARDRVRNTVRKFARERSTSQLRKSIVVIAKAVTQSCNESQAELLRQGLSIFPDGSVQGASLERVIALEIDAVDEERRRQRAARMGHVYRGGLPGTRQ